MTTAAVNATITTPRRTIDMIGPHFAHGNMSRGVKLSPGRFLVEMTTVILQARQKETTVGRQLNRTSWQPPEWPDDPARP
jgi:hypothetical protein